MKTVGKLLKEERLRKGFTLQQVERATKIRAKFLEAIEEEHYKKLPALPYVQGFLKNYSQFLGLRSTTILAIFRREYIQKERQNKEAIEAPLVESKWQITPNKVIVVAIAVLACAFLAYFYTQFQALHAPPPLTVESPQEDTVVAQEEIPVFGNTDVDATITINNEPVLVKEQGKFYKDIPLSPGINTITVTAQNRSGEKTVVMRKITRSQ